jgi:hypothetical protein
MPQLAAASPLQCASTSERGLNLLTATIIIMEENPMFLTDVVSGIVRLFILCVLPFILIHAGFTRLAGERIEGSRYVKFLLCCLHCVLKAIWRGSTALSDSVASALPAKYAYWKSTVKLVTYYAILITTFLALMTCMASFSRADYPPESRCSSL